MNFLRMMVLWIDRLSHEKAAADFERIRGKTLMMLSVQQSNRYIHVMDFQTEMMENSAKMFKMYQPADCEEEDAVVRVRMRR